MSGQSYTSLESRNAFRTALKVRGITQTKIMGNKIIGRVEKRPELKVELTRLSDQRVSVAIFDNDELVGPSEDKIVPGEDAAKFAAITNTLRYIHRPNPQPWDISDDEVIDENDFAWEQS